MSSPRLRFRKPDLTEFPNWEQHFLGSLGEFKNGINKSKEDFGFGVPFINLMDVFGKPFFNGADLGLVNAKPNEVKIYNLAKGDVLFIRSSVKPEGVGETSVILDDLPNTVYSGFLIRFREAKKSLDNLFKKYCFRTRSFRDQVLSVCTTSANTNINQDSLNGLQIFLPSIDEQTKIANFLTAVDAKISQLTKKHELLTSYKKGVMQKIFSQELRFKDDEGREFAEWEEKRLGEIATFFSGGTPLTTNRKFYDGNIPFIKSGEINSSNTAQFITEGALIKSSAKLVKSGDILYALYGATSGEVAIAKISGAINQAVLCIRPKLTNYFLYSYLRFSKDSILKKYIQGGQGNLSADIIKSLNICCPSTEEQIKISTFLKAIDDKITNAKSQLDTTKQYKQGLLQQMFV